VLPNLHQPQCHQEEVRRHPAGWLIYKSLVRLFSSIYHLSIKGSVLSIRIVFDLNFFLNVKKLFQTSFRPVPQADDLYFYCPSGSLVGDDFFPVPSRQRRDTKDTDDQVIRQSVVYLKNFLTHFVHVFI
jgi:hypothetical protein